MIGSARKGDFWRKGENGVSDRTISVTMIYPVMKTLVHKGLDTEAFCRFAGFDASVLASADARIPGDELERLTNAAARFSGDEFFGLHQGQLMEFADMGVLGYVMMHSRTIADALAAYRRYNDILCSGFNLDWETGGGMAAIRLYRPDGAPLSRHCAEDMAGSLLRLIGKLANRPVPLRKAGFMHGEPGDTAPYLPVFGIYPTFGEREHALYVDEETLNYSVMYSDPKLLSIFEELARETLDGLRRTEPEGGRMTERVEQWIRACMPVQYPSLRQTADHFEMSVRTLQNRLKQEGTTFSDAANRVRKEIAMACLGQEKFTVGDIAYALHFSEPSAFQNAFKKWTGMSPGQYRTKNMKIGTNPPCALQHGAV